MEYSLLSQENQYIHHNVESYKCNIEQKKPDTKWYRINQLPAVFSIIQ